MNYIETLRFDDHPGKINLSPEKGPFEKENSFPTMIYSGDIGYKLIFGEVPYWSQFYCNSCSFTRLVD